MNKTLFCESQLQGLNKSTYKQLLAKIAPKINKCDLQLLRILYASK